MSTQNLSAKQLAALALTGPQGWTAATTQASARLHRPKIAHLHTALLAGDVARVTARAMNAGAAKTAAYASIRAAERKPAKVARKAPVKAAAQPDIMAAFATLTAQVQALTALVTAPKGKARK